MTPAMHAALDRLGAGVRENQIARFRMAIAAHDAAGSMARFHEHLVKLDRMVDAEFLEAVVRFDED